MLGEARQDGGHRVWVRELGGFGDCRDGGWRDGASWRFEVSLRFELIWRFEVSWRLA